MTRKIISTIILSCICITILNAQNRYELNDGWKCLPSAKTKDSGEKISTLSYSTSDWKKAIVPGTVLGTQLENSEIPDPFYGMNIKKIPDISETGREYYTYWFVNDFKEQVPQNDEQVWLTFRGINYSCEIYLNGKKVNQEIYEGMFLRKTFNITNLLSKNGKNRLAVIVHPVDPAGIPNGGQGGDGTIARNVSHQYVAGWDWIQPIADRNTGIWDKVYIEKTGSINIKNPHIVTLISDKRKTVGKQDDAILKVSAEVQNANTTKISGILKYNFNGDVISQRVSMDGNTTTEISLPDYIVKNPKLWWPSGYGEQTLYDMTIEFVEDGKQNPSDTESVRFGIREIQTEWNSHTRSKQISVNGQKIFIKGGNWIISDAMLRFSDERYDAEIRYHRDMNLNLIRIWGGAITERPEFYEACDKYGLLVIQDFWFSGDCNGRWVDPKKTDDQWTRRKYPDNHPLVLESASDMIKMIRNHPSLAIWCGGNEIMPPADILKALKDSILPQLDGTRWFIDYSNSDEMSYNFLGGNGDGPYGIQPIESFWEHQTWPFNSEVGSVGVGDYESLVRFIPQKNLVAPIYNQSEGKETVDSVWRFHTYIGYDHHLLPYGGATDIKDFTTKAQLINYDQYRALMEGFSSHMWDWYTGSIIWKTQNPWTSMRGQMYDCYLDPNACLFGLRKGSEPLHIMCNPVDGRIMIVNNGFEQANDLMIVAKYYNIEGKETLITQELAYVEPSDAKRVMSIKSQLNRLNKEKGGFLYLQLLDQEKNVLSDNFYWYPDESKIYSGLKELKKAKVTLTSKVLANKKVEVSISNPKDNTVAFFNRISLVSSKTGERILPVFYEDNYISILPGETKKIVIEHTAKANTPMKVIIKGWNVDETSIEL